MRRFITLLLCVGFGVPSHAEVKPWDEAFKKQWYAGLAEITRYELKQAQYRDVHDGDAVLIFVTEDFLADKHVKRERGDGPSVSVLKLNATSNFTTGLYPYSVMTSVFTPVSPDQKHALKVTSTAQEWCGHTFIQLNRRDGGYHATVRSYFQSEGDRDLTLPDAILEDEIWTRIRLAPEQLPIGEIQIIPGAQFQRLAHALPKVQTARAELATGDTTQVYTLAYTSIDRKLAITFAKAYPHAILGWEESHRRRGRWLTTTARQTHAIRLDYWNKNKPEDTAYRAQLGLE